VRWMYIWVWWGYRVRTEAVRFVGCAVAAAAILIAIVAMAGARVTTHIRSSTLHSGKGTPSALNRPG
jgi:hypothetical protein